MPHYLKPQLLFIFALGFFSGLPLALTASTLTAWLADAKVDRSTIGVFAAVATPYAFKFVWAPLVDGIRLPWLGRLGRRRSWLLLTQALLALSIAFMGATNPSVDAGLTALAAVLVATLSATQDILIDAYRVERLTPEQQGQGAAMATLGYRIGMLLSGAGALALADALGWHMTYLLMAGIAALAILLTLLAQEPALTNDSSPAAAAGATTHGLTQRLQQFIAHSVVAPFRDFMTRPLWWQVLLFVVLYKLGDAFLGALFNPFLLDIGFTKTQIAEIVKLYGLAATLIGTFIGGWLVARWGTYKTLLLCGFGHMLTNLLMVEQANRGADEHFLMLSIILENASGGMSTAAFIAYLSALCKINYTATQYALLSAFAAFGRTWLSTPSGWVSEQLGWQGFFLVATALAIPGLLLLVHLQRKAALK